MKKLSFCLMIAAIAGICATSCTVEEDALYMISDGISQYSVSGSAAGDGATLFKAFTTEIIAFDNSHASDWEWVETIHNGHYDKADDRAKEKYDEYYDQIKAIYEKYQARFDACTDSRYSLYYEVDFSLKRVGASEDKELASNKLSISYK